MSYKATHQPCPKCNSSDAYSVSDNGWGHCFSCNTNIKEEEGAEVEYTPKKAIKMTQTVDIRAIHDRKLLLETAKFYKVGFDMSDNLHFPLSGGKASKVRLAGEEKKFRIEGNFADAKLLFGQELFPEGGKRIVVTEGELDAMSLYQMLGKYNVPVISVRNGAQSALKDVKENYKYLDTFEEVVFWFDKDEAGEKAVEECALVFSHKAKVVKGLEGYKDANDYLVANASAKAMKCFWDAQVWTPANIVNISSLRDAISKPMAKADAEYPYEGINKITHGIRKGELITITAGSGLGKSQFVKEIGYHILQTTQDRLGLMFMEESMEKTALSFASLHANKPFHIPTTECTMEEKLEAFDAVALEQRVFMFNHFGSSDVDDIVATVRYMAKALDCKYIMLDHISIIVSAQSNGDERKAIDEVMTKLRTMVESTGVSLILVSHLKRPEKKGHEEGAVTSLAQLRGSASIAQLSDMVIGLERNGQADCPIKRNTTSVRVLKNRFSGITGKAADLFYDAKTGRMYERPLLEEAL